MFSSTAYEALYQYIGLELHSRFVEVLTSQRVFMAAMLLIFGSVFFLTTVQYFARYMPGAVASRRGVPITRYIQIVVCLVVGLSILRVGSSTDVRRFNGEGWEKNSYVTANVKGIHSDYRVSLVFNVLSRTAEEISRLINRVIDRVFRVANSEVDAPGFFYKAIMYAGSSSIDDPDLRADVRRYTDNCVARVIPELGGHQGIDRLDTLFNRDDTVSRTLATLKLPEGDPAIKTCLDLKEKVEEGLGDYARGRSDEVEGELGYVLAPNFSSKEYRNLKVSSALLEQYQGETESHMGIQKGAQAPGTAARVLQYVNRFFSWDGVLSLVGDKYRGASMAAHRAEEFGENLARAPHVAGFIKLMLIAIFPWLVFPVVAGYWRVLLWWFTAYFSVLLWAPIWTLLYHVVTGITLSADTLAAMGRLSDGVSLYSANLVTSRINYMYAVYSWLQLLVGGAFTGSALWFIRPILSDKSDDSAPEFVGTVTSAAASVGQVLV